MKRVIALLFSLAISIGVYSQRKITGTVQNSDNEPLAYVNVGFIGTTIGTISDEYGNFELSYKTGSISVTDSLRFSMIGYHPQTIPIDKLDSKIEIFLRRQVFELEEIEVLFGGLKQKRIGQFNTSVLNMGCNFSLSDYENQNIGSEIGKKFIITKSTLVDSLRFFVLHNNYDTVGFRINIYSVKANRPHINLLTQDVIFEINEKATGWIVVDLTTYKINVEDNIIVSLQWIYKSESGNVLSLPISMPTPYTHYYKYGCQNNWKRFKSMTTRMKLDVRN